MSSTLRLLVTMLMVACALSLPQRQNNRLLEEEQEEMQARKAAENAHYNFKTEVDDGINDLTFHRDETRDGLVTRGSYSYSDGFTKRTVHYRADQYGYHIEKSTVEDLNEDGPVVNPSGTASVLSQLQSGQNVKYTIQSVPVDEP